MASEASGDPRCPHCGALLKPAEIATLQARMPRKARGRPKGGSSPSRRETIRAHELMTPLHDALLAGELSRASLIEVMNRVAAELQLQPRAGALSFALDRSKKEGLVSSPKWGVWGLTDAGRACSMSPQLARSITDKWDLIEYNLRRAKRATKTEGKGSPR